MKGIRGMVFAVTTAFLTMACTGCTSVSPHEQARIEPAVMPSLGMTMATSGLNQGTAAQSNRDSLSVHVASSQASRFAGVPIEIERFDTTQPIVSGPASFDVGPNVFAANNTHLEWTGNEALVAVAAERGRTALTRPGGVEKNIAAEIAISAPREMTGLNFDVGVAPRIAVRDEGELRTRRVGGEVRIGQNIDILDRNGQPQGWYIFAGADGEALVWDADRDGFRPNLGDVSLTDQVTVGDLQAGVSVQRGGGELSLSYIRREVSYSDRNGSFSDTEDFAGISFTMRR